MWFRNLHLYRVHAVAGIDGGCIAERVEAQAARPLGGSESRRIGWTPPAGRASSRQQLYHHLQGQYLLTALRRDNVDRLLEWLGGEAGQAQEAS